MKRQLSSTSDQGPYGGVASCGGLAAGAWPGREAGPGAGLMRLQSTSSTEALRLLTRKATCRRRLSSQHRGGGGQGRASISAPNPCTAARLDAIQRAQQGVEARLQV